MKKYMNPATEAVELNGEHIMQEVVNQSLTNDVAQTPGRFNPL